MKTTIMVDESDEPGEWLGTQDAARRLGVTARTLYRFIDEGDIPAYKMGRVLRLRISDVDAFLESRRVQPGDLKHLYPPRLDIDDADDDG